MIRTADVAFYSELPSLLPNQQRQELNETDDSESYRIQNEMKLISVSPSLFLRKFPKDMHTNINIVTTRYKKACSVYVEIVLSL